VKPVKNTGHPSPFEREISRAGKQLRKALESYEVMKQRLEAGDIEGAYQSAFDFADTSERLTLISRELPAYTGNPQAQKASEQIMLENMPVRMGFTPEGWFGVVIPALLPKKQKGSADYIRSALYLAMGNFFRGKPAMRYTDCVMVFRHVYRRDRPEREYRDHDNIEINAVADIVALYVLFDDSPLRCAHYYCSASGDENRTEVLVVPQSEFVAWIVGAKSHKNRAMILQENLPKT
jgi:hypothetical protein